MDQYILSIDQSTSTTKALLFDKKGKLFRRSDTSHRQLIDEKGWVEHDPLEIYANLLHAVKSVIHESGISTKQIVGASISNQRETSLAWNRETGEPVYNAIVWQCGRGEAICKRLERHKTFIKERTGLNLSPYFSAAKFAWILENVPKAQELAREKHLVCSTIDSWLVKRLTVEHSVLTEYSNASRTQLFNINTLDWDRDVCSLFGLSPEMLPPVHPSDSLFGYTDFGGIFDDPIPLHGVLGDSHGALFAQGCLQPGMVKATYGTGSSIMMNIGDRPIFCKDLVTSLAWGLEGNIQYVLEGNINYSGATITWLVDDLQLLGSAREVEALASKAKPVPGLYLVPAFSGLGAPYWEGNARAMVCGMNRTTGKAELVRAAEESIGYQIADIIELMKKESGYSVPLLKVDGGATRDAFLMQFQADILQSTISIASLEELSGQGAAFACGLALGFYEKSKIFPVLGKHTFKPIMKEAERDCLYQGWQKAISCTLSYGC
ncbi:glycerol kinase GlpK [uncultured Sphaerochaeta sp.]|uniref:FGGY-family carbohydrate kinase n=1 Tax=uncultured Sphaerochaeta sp. TaxID=886478 RepID=UPI002A0A2355|nr:glycerol kinase GlpK [uncultured Sphaerochaeta sp.]